MPRVQGVVDRVTDQLQQQRLKRALLQSRDKPVDVQIGFTVYLAVPQEMRSRLWLVLIQQPALAAPFQVRGAHFRLLGGHRRIQVLAQLMPRTRTGLHCKHGRCFKVVLAAVAHVVELGVQELGRFPDLGAYTAGSKKGAAEGTSASFKSTGSVSPVAGSPLTPWSTRPNSTRAGAGSAADGATPFTEAAAAIAKAQEQQDAEDLVQATAPGAGAEAGASTEPAEMTAAAGSNGDVGSPGAAAAAASAGEHPASAAESPTADISDVCSEDTHAVPQGSAQAAQHDILRGGELSPGGGSPTFQPGEPPCLTCQVPCHAGTTCCLGSIRSPSAGKTQEQVRLSWRTAVLSSGE